MEFKIKNIDNSGKISGYASVFNIEDSYNDIIIQNAFQKSLAEKNIQQDIKMFWQHDQNQPIGNFNIIKEDEIGLYIEGQISLNTEKGLEVYNLVKNKIITGLSIGYSVKEAEYEKNNKKRILKEIELHEISIVSFPANKYSNITYCKSKNIHDIILEKLDFLEKSLL